MAAAVDFTDTEGIVTLRLGRAAMTGSFPGGALELGGTTAGRSSAGVETRLADVGVAVGSLVSSFGR